MRSAAHNIIEGKGATYYGIGSALARIVSAVVNNQRAVLTVCTPKLEVAGVLNVTLSLPHLVGGSGILSTLPLPLEPNEEKVLKESALLIKNVTDELDRQK